MRMSYDVTTAYSQGVNEANLAVERLAELGLTNPDKSGSVVYYDIEHYGTLPVECRQCLYEWLGVTITGSEIWQVYTVPRSVVQA
jgi:hypothetical protein